MYRFHVTFRSPKDPGGLSDYPSYLRHLRGNEANVVPSGGTDLRENTKEIDHATDQKATDRVLSLENRRLVSGCCRHTGRVKRRAESHELRLSAGLFAVAAGSGRRRGQAVVGTE